MAASATFNSCHCSFHCCVCRAYPCSAFFGRKLVWSPANSRDSFYSRDAKHPGQTHRVFKLGGNQTAMITVIKQSLYNEMLKHRTKWREEGCRVSLDGLLNIGCNSPISSNALTIIKRGRAFLLWSSSMCNSFAYHCLNTGSPSIVPRRGSIPLQAQNCIICSNHVPTLLASQEQATPEVSQEHSDLLDQILF